jgi:hypothetical protein
MSEVRRRRKFVNYPCFLLEIPKFGSSGIAVLCLIALNSNFNFIRSVLQKDKHKKLEAL